VNKSGARDPAGEAAAVSAELPAPLARVCRVLGAPRSTAHYRTRPTAGAPPRTDLHVRSYLVRHMRSYADKCLTGHFDVDHFTFQFEPASHAAQSTPPTPDEPG